MANILVCDDDKEIVDAIEIYLSQDGYHIFKAYDGEQAIEMMKKEEIHLLIMDVMMPRLDGIRATLKIRSYSSIPIIILSAKSEDTDKILGLNIGADDYITKPFGVMELISRVKALLRRTEDATNPAVLAIGGIVLDTDKRSVTVNGQACELTYKEFELLKLLISNRGIVLSREKIMDKVWGFEYEGESRTVDMHIKTLRQKLGDAGSAIKTVRNVGYRMEDETDNPQKGE